MPSAYSSALRAPPSPGRSISGLPCSEECFGSVRTNWRIGPTAPDSVMAAGQSLAIRLKRLLSQLSFVVFTYPCEIGCRKLVVFDCQRRRYKNTDCVLPFPSRDELCGDCSIWLPAGKCSDREYIRPSGGHCPVGGTDPPARYGLREIPHRPQRSFSSRRLRKTSVHNGRQGTQLVFPSSNPCIAHGSSLHLAMLCAAKVASAQQYALQLSQPLPVSQASKNFSAIPVNESMPFCSIVS